MLDDDLVRKEAIAALTRIVTFRLARTQNKLNAQMTYLLRQTSDLSLVEWRILRMIAAYGPATMADLARLVEMDKGQLSRKVHAMTERDLITLIPDPVDHRKLILSLSPSAEGLLERLMPMVSRRIDGLVGDIPADDLETFFNVLAHIDRAAEQRDLI